MAADPKAIQRFTARRGDTRYGMARKGRSRRGGERRGEVRLPVFKPGEGDRNLWRPRRCERARSHARVVGILIKTVFLDRPKLERMNHDQPMNAPRPIGPEEAAALLMGKRHLVFVANPKIEEYRESIQTIVDLGLAGSSILCITAESKPFVGGGRSELQGRNLASVPDPTVDEFILLFALDGPANRVVMALSLVLRGGPRALGALTSENAEAPIVVFEDPAGCPANEGLKERYMNLMCALASDRRGKALDTPSN
jgi:hypothetical protein